MSDHPYEFTDALGDLRSMLNVREGRCTRSVEEVAVACDIAPSTLRGVMSTHLPYQIQLLQLVTRATGDTLGIERLCERLGGAFIPLPSGKAIDAELIPDVVTKYAAFISDACAAMRDGKVSKQEADRAQRDGFDAIAAILRGISELRHQAECNCSGRVGVMTAAPAVVEEPVAVRPVVNAARGKAQARLGKKENLTEQPSARGMKFCTRCMQLRGVRLFDGGGHVCRTCRNSAEG